MFFILRKYLVTFLVLLQFVAPLVHAHAGEKALVFPNTSAGKLHVPGLEMLVIAEAVHAEYGSAALDAPTEGIIIGVDTGIKRHLNNDQSDADHGYYLHQQTVVFTAEVSPFDGNFSPQTTAVIRRPSASPHTPRAPPAR